MQRSVLQFLLLWYVIWISDGCTLLLGNIYILDFNNSELLKRSSKAIDKNQFEREEWELVG